MEHNRRKHKRFSATAFLNLPVILSPLPPYFGHLLRGKLIDLSTGGMSIVIDELIPLGSKLGLLLRFPDQSELNTVVEIKHAMPKGRLFLHGIEFLQAPSFMTKKIETMSTDYIDCENRIRMGEKDICRLNCAFFNMCQKPERRDPVFDVDVALELAFRSLHDSPTRAK